MVSVDDGFTAVRGAELQFCWSEVARHVFRKQWPAALLL